ncbi:MAG: DUF6607 family protein [Planctomycetota bacterium]
MGRLRLAIGGLFLGACLGSGGCVGGGAVTPTPTADPGTIVSDTEADRREADRAAILAMAGAYTLDLPAAPADASGGDSGGNSGGGGGERVWVGVAEDTGDRIVLVRLLVTGEPALVVKTGREDWVYRPESVLRYVGDGVWRRETLEAGDGVWTRTVYAADGGPGYGAVGRWTHHTSDDALTGGDTDVSVWAPTLPTRMPPATAWNSSHGPPAQAVLDRVTVRLARNPARRALHWRLEQAVTRLRSARAPGVSPRTVWASDYTPATRVDEDQAGFEEAEAYWRRVAPFWAAARAAWDDVLSGSGPWQVRETIDGEPRWRRLFELADAAAGSTTDLEAWREQVQAVLADGMVEPVASVPGPSPPPRPAP